MDKDSKALIAKAEKVLKGARGFVFVGLMEKDNVDGGLVGNKTSMYRIAHSLAVTMGMSDTQLGLYLMKAGLGLDDSEDEEKPAKKKVAKKAVAKKKVASKKKA